MPPYLEWSEEQDLQVLRADRRLLVTVFTTQSVDVPHGLLLPRISAPDEWHSWVPYNSPKHCTSKNRLRPYEMMTLISFHQPLTTPRIRDSSTYAQWLVAELRGVISAILSVMSPLHEANM